MHHFEISSCSSGEKSYNICYKYYKFFSQIFITNITFVIFKNSSKKKLQNDVFLSQMMSSFHFLMNWAILVNVLSEDEMLWLNFLWENRFSLNI